MDVRLRTWSGFYVQAETGQLEKVQVSRYPLLMTTLKVQLPLCRWGSTCEARVPVCPQWLCSTDLSRTPFPSPMGIFLSIQSLNPFCWPGFSVLIFSLLEGIICTNFPRFSNHRKPLSFSTRAGSSEYSLSQVYILAFPAINYSMTTSVAYSLNFAEWNLYTISTTQVVGSKLSLNNSSCLKVVEATLFQTNLEHFKRI